MKKNYTTPSVEKIAFRYRDQVVTASGTDGGQTIIDGPSTGEQIIARIAEGLGWGICQDYECVSWADRWA